MHHTPSEDFVPRAELRYREIPEEVWQVAIKNPIVQQVAHAYATGNIVTLEECLACMVLALAEHDAAKDKLLADLAGQCRTVRDLFSR